MLKKCPECGKFFSCNNSGDCWCESYQVPQDKLKVLWHKNNDCICQQCLAKLEV
ncbi:MAG: hypothetical protein HC896_14580 [Bacteroidales bacterium]|nr:hypothetical protein [Bacteroidales bacterium]